ncbi:unnamed protein product [Rotaria sordida]|uniref:FLYWCH-type domain-containing protein n=1 Tax=Rotaria sordida TaxID=392033 RepID=A0A815H526_9BILA|nr:unnamed protein product [Rotaria sordida]CAF1346417.1 unnamed protein product [Rotaria sordida]
MNTTFVWSTTEKGEKAILYNSYLYRLKCENQNGSLISICTFKWCSRIITLKNDAIIKTNGENYNHDLKLPEKVRTMLCGLKYRRLTDVDEPVTKLYEDEVKRFRSENSTAGPVPVFDEPYKVIAFGSEQALNLLSINPHWNDDGTFRTSPALFSQSYYLHIWDEFSMKTIVYSCCQDKSEECYHELLKLLLTYATTKKILY